MLEDLFPCKLRIALASDAAGVTAQPSATMDAAVSVHVAKAEGDAAVRVCFGHKKSKVQQHADLLNLAPVPAQEIPTAMAAP